MLNANGGNGTKGILTNPPVNSSHSVLPTPIPGKKTGTNVPASPAPTETNAVPVIARPGMPLISAGVVPGISRVLTGGTVAATGVTTSFGRMTAMGVQLPNGTINNEVVIRACCSNGNCLPSRPCGMVPGCGGLVSLAAVTRIPASNLNRLNSVMLASAYQMQGATGQVVQAGGQYINPVTGMPVYGLTMSGYPQAGYPPIGYAPSGYAPGYPQQNLPQNAQSVANAMLLNEQLQDEQLAEDEETEEEQEESVLPVSEPKSQMPLPRFHPISTKPAFQRSEGLPLKSSSAQKTTALSRQFFSDTEEEEEVEQSDSELAYLAGMEAAMDQVEEELGNKEREREKKQRQETIVKRAEELQAKIDKQRQEEERLEQEKAEQEERLQAQQEEQRHIEDEERAAWEEAVRTQLAEAKRREERLKKQLQQQQVQIQEQTELNEMLAVQQVQETPPVRQRQSSPQTGQVQSAYSRRLPAQEVQPVHFAAPLQETAQGSSPVAPIPVTISSDTANRQPFLTPVREVGGLFESAFNYLKGNETAQPRRHRQQVPQERQHTAAVQRSSEEGLLQSAKAAGSGLLSAVNGAVAPLSNILGSAEPVIPQQSVQRSMSAAKSAQQSASIPIPVQPPILRAPRRDSSAASLVPPVAASQESADFQEELEPQKPTRPPTVPKRIKKIASDEEDAPVIRQVNFFE